MASVKKVELGSDGLAAESGVMTVYSYDPETGLCTGASDEYLAQGVGIPANSTTNVPAACKSGKVCVFNDGEWVQVDDHRGETVYSTATLKPVEITLPGEYPEGTTPLKPATAFDVWSGKAWKTDVKAQQAAAVSDAVAKKSALIIEANSVTQAWQTQLLLSIITDVDRASLTRWMQYIQEVQATDESGAPDINWPEKPE
ncbi:tail fiber assembly protein [Candidatus Pantoea floridensis]|uniref:Virus tail fibre assembly protein, lambda gpK n=1 Tax=Candidatus Pantoea floridensis TaxID=1938870 RepID=A0A286BYN0_9GAMM|nr:tail fiber assembly protein [Pantoea floridensis]PIF21755.1 virus tail fiber assembly protein lambda gpK [Enterobacteriaceae bacterium JKS000233]SOD39265.1 virus tail fibre assembly protein, lambda gpK [Pantoea floridensis]